MDKKIIIIAIIGFIIIGIIIVVTVSVVRSKKTFTSYGKVLEMEKEDKEYTHILTEKEKAAMGEILIKLNAA